MGPPNIKEEMRKRKRIYPDEISEFQKTKGGTKKTVVRMINKTFNLSEFNYINTEKGKK